MSQDTPSRNLDKIVIRVPDGMRDRIAAAAAENKRSVNAELVALLEGYYPPRPSLEDLKLSLEMLKTDLRQGAGKSDHWLKVVLDDISDILQKRSSGDKEPQ